MQNRLSRKNIIFFLGMVSVYIIINIESIFAIPLEAEAESYREKGYEAQERGDVDSAIAWYQKAVVFDKNYAVPHNDLGILYETKSWLDRAEQEYLRALSIDPNYSKAHTNLALLYERKGELEKAAFHWMKRYRYGEPGERWTLEAKVRLERLGLLDEKELRKRIPFKEEPTREEEIKKEQKAEKDVSGWERIGTKRPRRQKEKEKIAKAPKVKKKTLDKEFQKELQKSLRVEEERVEKRKARKKVAKKIDTEIPKAPAPRAKKKEIDKRLQESLNLAWERLRREKVEEKFSKDEGSREVEKYLDLEETKLQEVLDLAEESSQIKEAKKIDEWPGSFPTTRPEERSPALSEERAGRGDEGSHEVLQPFGLQDDSSEKNKKKSSPRGQIDIDEEFKMSLKLEKERQQRGEAEKKGKTLDEEVKELLVIVDEKLEKQRSITEDLDKEKSRGKITDPKARTYYSAASGFYKKGEYSRALDVIRGAKNELPEESSLLELEQTVKNKMKEERINDHYIEAMMLYEQKDLVGAKKEFEAILNMLPE